MLAANIVCVCSSMMFVFVPLLVDSLRHGKFNPSPTWIALIGSSDVTGMFVGAIIALFTVHRFDRRYLAFIGLGALCMADGVSILDPSTAALLCGARILAGSGAGLAMGVAYAAFGQSEQPERVFALFGLLQTAFGSAVIILIAPLISRIGPTVIFWASLLLGLTGVMVAGLIEPLKPQRIRPITGVRTPAVWGLAPLTAVTYFLFGISSLGIWANIESIGRSFGLTLESAAHAISFSLLGSVVGCLLVMTTGSRWGRLLPSATIGAVYLLGLGLLLVPQQFVTFVIAVTAFQFGTNLGSHAFGALSDADPYGRLSVTYLLALKAGFAMGPLSASWLLTNHSYQQLIWIGFVLSAVVLALVNITTQSAVIYSRRMIQSAEGTAIADG